MSQSPTANQNIYTKQGLWSLFLMCAFPLHLWTLLLAFRDVSWVAERTNAWDAVGVASYGMLFALVESFLLFVLFALIGFVLPRYWKADKRIGFLILLVFILSIWGMVGQLLFLWNINLPSPAIHFLAGTAHPLRWLYAMAFFLVTPTVILPIYHFWKNETALSGIEEIVDRLSLLAGLYLFFDIIGIVVLISRNV